LQFRYRGSRRKPAVAQLFSLGHLSHHKNKHIMKHIAKSLLVIITAIALFVSCSTKSSIVGKWQEFGADNGDNETLEFFKDGTVSDVSQRMTLAGKYSFVEDDRLKLEFGGIGALAGPMIMHVSISGGELDLTDQKGKVSKYNRVN
jgi:hypothetical protein